MAADSEAETTAAAKLTVVADMNLCEGYGECVRTAPAFFSLDEDGYVSIADPAVPNDPEEETRVIRGVSACPKAALKLLADGEPVDLP